MMTPRQKQLLDFLSAEAREGRCPTFRGMAGALGFSLSGTRNILCGLEERGFIRRIPNRACAIEVLRPTAPNQSVPPSVPRIELGRYRYIPVVWNTSHRCMEVCA